MDMVTIFEKFPNQEACIAHLENVRWGNEPHCPHCDSTRVARKAEGAKIGRWNCHDCKSSFNVLSKTVFQKTKIPLQKWFLGISLVLNAKKSLSSHQLARDLNLTRQTAWYMKMRIRRAMVDNDVFLIGIVEADETYVGGDPKNRRNNDDDPPKRGRGTKKKAGVGSFSP